MFSLSIGFVISAILASTLAQGPGPCSQLPYPPSISDVNAFLSEPFDYVVVGGGTAGLAVATRLAQDGRFKVGVIEAGPHHKVDDLVDIPQIWGQAWGNGDYDWNFQMVPQANAANRVISMPRGRMLGGSSGINGMAWNRATKTEYNAWATIIRDSSWTWDGLLPFMKRSENIYLENADPFPGLTPSERERANEELLTVSGFTGPLNASHGAFYVDTVPPYVNTMNALGIPTVGDPQGGNPFGVYNTWNAIRRPDGTRSYSAKQYYCAGVGAGNIKVLVGATGHKLLFNGANTNGDLIASSVQFSAAGQTRVLNATREIIISGGPIKSPQLLELSGVGDPSVLNRFNIPVKVNLTGVGANLQEHVWAGVQYELKDGVLTFDILRNNATYAAEAMAEYRANGTGPYSVTDAALTFFWQKNFTSSTRWNELLALFDEAAANIPANSLRALQYPIQREWFASGSVPSQEVIQLSSGAINPEAGKSYAYVLGGSIHPLARGSVHITSADPGAPLAIDPAFYGTAFDRALAVETLKFAQTVGQTAPYSGIIAAQTNPPLGSSDAELLEWAKQVAASGGHYIGTTALAPRDHEGVVDANLKVYGLANVRVVDVGIFPLPIGHTQATAYAIAEKAVNSILSAV